MEPESLRGRTLWGVIWMSADRLLLFAVAAVVTAVLARLLPPSDFGVVGAALVAVEVAVQIVNAAVTPALVQRSAVSRAHYSAAFWLSVTLSIVLFALVVAATPFVAEFFEMPPLATLLPVLAIVVLFDGACAVARAKQQRALAFREVVIIRAVADVIGLGVCSVALALSGYGVWALVGGRLAQGVLRTVGFLARFPHPVRGATRVALGDIVRFGGGVTLQGALNSLARQGDSLIVGRFLGANALGLYNRAYEVMSMPAAFLSRSFSGVLFPVMALAQDRVVSLQNATYRSTGLLALLLFPLSALLVVLAPEVVLVVLGPDWLGAVDAVRILSAGIFFRAGYKVGETILQARGRVYIAAALQGGYAVVIVLSAWWGAQWGIEGVAVAALCGAAIYYVAVLLTTLHEIGGSPLALVTAFFPGMLLALIGGAAAYGVATPLRGAELSSVVTLLAGVVASGALWLTILAFAPRMLGKHGLWLRALLVSELNRFMEPTPPSGP